MNNIKKILNLIVIMTITNITQANVEVNNYQTTNGVKVLYSKSENIPMIDIKITFDAGSNRDGDFKGLSMITHNLLDEGTAKMSSEDIASIFESTGAIFSTSVNKDQSSISLRSLTEKKYYNPAIKMFLSILSDSNFPQKEIDLHKQRTISSIIEDKTDPGELSINTFFKEIYNNHPYASPTIGFEKDIKKINRKAIVEFYKNYINAGNASIVIVSSLKDDDVIKLSEKISQSLNKKTKINKTKTVSKEKTKEKYVFKKFNSQQAHIYIGGLSIKRGSKNQLPLYVGNYIFGGSGFNARLMQELRVKRGLTYGVYSYIYPMKELGPFVIGIETKAEQAQKSVEIINKMLKDFVAKGPTDKEINHAKESIINGFPLRIDSNKDILNYLSMINYYNLPLDYLNTFVKKISSISKKDIINALQNEIDINKMTTLVVGNEKAKK